MKKLQSRFNIAAMTTVVGILLFVNSAFAQNDQILVKSGEKIAFLGDSITQQGNDKPVRLVMNGLEANGVKADKIPGGISGQKSNDMLARVKRHLLDRKPQWMTISCGVNDVWHGARGVSLEDYKKNITAIVDQATAANVKVVILTSTLIGERQQPDSSRLQRFSARVSQRAQAAHRRFKCRPARRVRHTMPKHPNAAMSSLPMACT